MRRLRGPPLGVKLLLLFATLLVVPYFSFRQVIEIESLLVQGQSQAQLLTARGIATLLNGRDDMLAPPVTTSTGGSHVEVLPLATPIAVDGLADDWPVQSAPLRRLQPADGPGSPFDLLLGEHAGYLYGLVRPAAASPLPNSSGGHDPPLQMRVRYADTEGGQRHVMIHLDADSAPVARVATADWQAANGAIESRIHVARSRSDAAMQVEFRLPIALLGNLQQLAIGLDRPAAASVVDVDLFVPRSPEVLNIVQGLAYAGARVRVIDTGARTRADVGSYRGIGSWSPPLPADGLEHYLEFLQPLARRIVRALPREHDGLSASESEGIEVRVVDAALGGEALALRRPLADATEIIVAGYPVVSRDRTIGAVILEQNTNELLALQRQALERIVALSLLSMLVVVVSILLFSVRLAWRIRSLRRDTSNAIDQHGRLRTGRLRAQIHAGDEIGDLARSVAGVLARLQQHTRFLETIPRTLRHELNNPLNVVSTSLQNLEQQVPDLQGSSYIDAAKRGVLRIGGIVAHLADAASLEESLETEELEPIDLRALVASYVENCRIAHPQCTFTLQNADQPATVLAADYRIEQLLDKIVDNAIDFHHPGTPIVIQLDVERDHVQLTVANRGPALPDDVADNVFDSMVSQRTPGDQRVHFGLGLFVVRSIALHHGGSVRAVNLPDRTGVVVSVRLPLLVSDRSRQRLRGSVGGGTTANGDGGQHV